MAGTKAMKMSTVYYRRKVINAKNISWDVSNVTMMYNSSLAGKVNTNPYSNRPKSYLTIMDGDSDLSSSAPVILKAVGVEAFWYRGTSSGTIGSSTGVTGTGKIRVEISAMTADSGTITATSVAAPGLSATIDCVRVTNRYTFELVCNPTQITYNMTTGVKSAESFAINLYVNKSNGGREKATFAAYGALNWRYVGTTTWTAYSKQGTQEATITPNFSENGIEVQFVDANGVVGDTKTLSILKISNGRDSYAVISGSTSISLMLESLDHGAPIGDVINTIALTKNGVALASGVEYTVPASSDGDKSTVDDSFPTASNEEYYGWVFNYSLSGGMLKSTLVKVLEGSPTSVQVPIDIYYKDGSVEIWRQALISYSVIMKGPAGRSYKPNVAVIWNDTDTYVWNDAQRDFVYYPFTENDETDYYLYGVKTYNPKGGLKNIPPSKKDGDDYWELVSKHSTIITNCIFGTNAIMGGFTFTKETMMSQSLDKNGESNIIIDGDSGTFKGNNFVGKDCNISGVINATSGSFKGEITATSGTIGGFKINADSLGTSSPSNINGVYLSSEVVIFNDTSNRQAFLGVSSVLGKPILCRLTDIKSDTLPKYGIVFNIDNSSYGYNMAFTGKGHGVLNGMVEGFMLNDFTPSSSANTISPQKGNYVIVKGSYTTVYLPTLSECRESLGLSTTSSTKFAMMMTVVCAGGKPTAFTLYGYRSSTYGANCPHLRDNNYSDLTGGIKMGAGDIVRVLITYDGSNFDAYLISHRD